MKRIYSTLLLLAGSAALTACLGESPNVAPVGPEPTIEVVGDKIYALSTQASAVIQIVPGAQGEGYTDQEGVLVRAIYVGEGPQALFAMPEHNRVLLFSHPTGQTASAHTLAVVDGDAECTGEQPVDLGCVTSIEAKPLHDQLVASPDGRFALSYISAESAAQADEVVINLNEVGIYDLEAGTVQFATVGFDPRSFAFTKSESAPRVVILTASEVVLLDLLTGKATPRELTLSSSTQVRPSEVQLTDDDSYALVSIDNSPDLFTFDLTQESLPINILSLSGEPIEMGSQAGVGETVILTQGQGQADVVNHSDFSVTHYPLSSPANRILWLPGRAQAALYDATGNYPYLHILDLDRKRVQTYLLDNPCTDVRVSDDGGALVLFYVPDNEGNDGALDDSYAVAILNLDQGDRQPTPILVSNYPAGALFVEGAEPQLDSVLVPLNDRPNGALARFNLSSYDVDVFDIPYSPQRIQALQTDGRVVVSHSATLGMISIFPPNAPESVQFISHFLAQDIL